MQESRWRRIEELFNQAVIITEETDRRRFVEETCGGDDDLRRELLDLLWEDEHNQSFLTEPIFTAGLEVIDSDFSRLLQEGSFAGYDLLEPLGRGGMGMVFLAEDKTLKRRVALKIIAASLTDHPENVRRFRREARAASNISHPNVAHIYEFGQHEDFYFLAMEYVAGKTLRELLAENSLDRPFIIRIVLQVADALAAAHQKGIMHRDIKPENIVVTDDGRVKILDFGLAKINREKAAADSQVLEASLLETSPGYLIGTTAYMSPEQIRGQDIDFRTDVWSLGVVLYEMLNGRRPFEGETRSDLLAAILKIDVDPQYDPAESDPLQAIARKALRKNRDERYQTAEEMRDALRRVKNDLDAASFSPLRKTFAPVRKAKAFPGKYRYAFGAVLLIGLIVFGAWFFASRNQPSDSQIRAVAILPFINESGDEDNEYLSDGMTESLINRLSQLPNLTVKARNSVFRYKGKPFDLKKIEKELSVQAVLLGRIAKRGDDLTLNLELVDVRTGDQIWGEQYNRKTGDLVALQNDIARDVSEKLRKKLTGAETQKLTKVPTENAEAYMLYLKGRFHWGKRTAKDLQKSVEYYEQALRLDPRFALAYAGLADSYVLFSGFGVSSPGESFPKAKQAAEKALAIDETLAEAHTALAYVLFNYEWNFEASNKEMRRAIELNPNYATAYHWNGNANLLAMGKLEEAIVSVQRAHELDPLSLIISADLGNAYLYAGRYDEAAEQYKKTIELDDKFYYAHAYLGRTYLMKGEYEKALAAFAKAQELGDDPRVLMLTARAYSKMGRRADALKMLEKLERMSKERYVSPYYFALVHTGLGDKDKAFEWLERAYREHEGRMTLIKVDELLRELRGDPRFLVLVKRVGLDK